MKRVFFWMSLLIFAGCTKPGTNPPAPDPCKNTVTYDNSSLVAVDPAGKEIGFDYRSRRDKKVGIFYFVWLGAHGYDVGEYFGGDTPQPKASDVNSPYDISELEKGIGNPQSVPYAPRGVMHHWGKPYLDYYVSNDRWVIRRHAQMLSEAGVDVIFIDLTNGYSYLPVLKVLCEVYHQMWREMSQTPQISFVLNANPAPVMNDLLTLYNDSNYARLWYNMDGKPLILAPLNENYGAGVKDRFTLRYAWFDTQFGYGGSWWNGAGQWSWGEFSPQRIVKEEMPVMAASHAHWNVGRSFSGNSPTERGGGVQPSNTTAQQRAAGTYFRQQFERALEGDPDLIFITAWNEWTAQRQVNGESPTTPWFLGRRIYDGDTYFVDAYNHEYSRDIEPLANDFLDTYYYYMVDYVRRYKGVDAVPPVTDMHPVAIDGEFDDWAAVCTRYKDYKGDTSPRHHWGYGYRNINMVNETGRNDFTFAKVATDGRSVFFQVETAEAITSRTDPDWMRLFISVKGSQAPHWEGFGWMVNGTVTGSGETVLSRSKGGWSWEEAATVKYAVNGNKMEIAIPLATLGITDARSFTLDFKWIDNSVPDGDITRCMTDGDSAPGDRFRYRYIFGK